MEYASRGTAGAGLGFGIAGTALGLLGGGANWLGGMNRGWGYGCGYGYGDYSYERELDHRIRDVEIMADKDAAIASLQAEKYADNNGIELYKQFRADLKDALEPIREDIKELQKFEKDQAVYNGVNTATVSVTRSQVDQLLALTALKIPSTNVDPLPMPRYNQWSIDPLADKAAK